MENIKVKVNNETESKEVQELFVVLGYMVVNNIDCEKGYIVVSKNAESPINFDYWHDVKNIITIQKLRDLVVLKRNSLDDATHTTTDDVWKFYIGHDTYCYERKNGVIGWHKEDSKCYDLKPIEENELKEFLVYYDNKWTFQLLDSDTQENSYRVAVPRGATFYAEDSNMGVNGDYFFRLRSDDFDDEAIYLNGNWMRASFDVRNMTVLWQRSETEYLMPKETGKGTIDGVEAFNAIANDITVQYRFAGGEWKDYTQDLNHEGSKLKAVHFLCDLCEFRYKPKTIVVNGVEYEDEQKAVKVVQDYFKGYVK